MAVAVMLLALCVFFHLYRLDQTPGWDAQEGYNLDIAWNLLHGRLRLFALTSDFAQHPPLFYLQLALAIRLVGYNILALRALTALYAVLTCGAILLVGRRVLGVAPALWAAAIYTVAPVILANTRWGYSYAQLAFVGLLCLWAAWRYMQSASGRWLAVAALLAGVAAFSDYEGVAWMIFVALVAWRVDGRGGWRRATVALALGFGVLLLGLLACLIAAPGVFVADFWTTLMRAGGGNPILQALELLLNYYRFLSYDPWLLLGVIGLFLIPRSPSHGFLLGATTLLALVTLKVRDIGPSLHTAVPLLPLLALGAGMALYLAVRYLDGWLTRWLAPLFAFPSNSITSSTGGEASGRPSVPPLDEFPGGDVGASRPSSPIHPAHRLFKAALASLVQALAFRDSESGRPLLLRLVATLIVFMAVVSPVAMATASDVVALSSSLTTQQNMPLAPPDDAQAMANYIYAHARPDDLVVASPAVAWMFDGPENAPSLRGADILQLVAQTGQAAAFYPANLPADRWAFPVTLSAARYVVVDDLVRQLVTPDQLPALIPLLRQVEQWPIVLTRGQYVVYGRPGTAT